MFLTAHGCSPESSEQPALPWPMAIDLAIRVDESGTGLSDFDGLGQLPLLDVLTKNGCM
jgi:hypothetical protein